MAPPPSSAAEVRSPCWRRAIHRTKGQCWRHISPGPAGGSLSRQARRPPIREPSRNPSEADSTPFTNHKVADCHRTPFSPPLPAIGGPDQPPSTYSLPNRDAYSCGRLLPDAARRTSDSVAGPALNMLGYARTFRSACPGCLRTDRRSGRGACVRRLVDEPWTCWGRRKLSGGGASCAVSASMTMFRRSGTRRTP